MNKETEELIIIAIGAFLLFSIMGGSSTAAAKLQATENTTYANDATSVLKSAIGILD